MFARTFLNLGRWSDETRINYQLILGTEKKRPTIICADVGAKRNRSYKIGNRIVYVVLNRSRTIYQYITCTRPLTRRIYFDETIRTCGSIL